MAETYYVGLDIHKKVVSYCVKRACGEGVDEGVITVLSTAPRGNLCLT